MQSNDRDHFFETDESLAQKARREAKAGNKHGNPIVLKSKILAAIPDPASPLTQIFVAESSGFAQRVNLDSSEPKTTYRGPKAPLTCVAVGGASQKTLFAGCWDKDIWSWDIETAKPGRKYSGHADFVKAVVCATLKGDAGDQQILISGGADKKIIVWDVETGHRLHTLQDPATPMMAVQHLVVDPFLSSDGTIVVASAGSDPHIRRWRITRDAAEQLPEKFADRPSVERFTIEEHETSVYRLLFDDTYEDDDGENGEVGGDLWTASADGTAKCLSRAEGFVEAASFTHGDYVRAVLVTDQWVITAGRDENVKVWDRGSGKLYCVLEGHYEEITDLVLLRDTSSSGGGRPQRVCSVGIDRTVRTWPLGKGELDEVVKEIERAATKPEGGDEEKGESLLTAEEEAELRELMED